MEYSVHGILQARILEWVALPFSRGSSQPSNQTQVSHIFSIKPLAVFLKLYSQINSPEEIALKKSFIAQELFIQSYALEGEISIFTINILKFSEIKCSIKIIRLEYFV